MEPSIAGRLPARAGLLVAALLVVVVAAGEAPPGETTIPREYMQYIQSGDPSALALLGSYHNPESLDALEYAATAPGIEPSVRARALWHLTLCDPQRATELLLRAALAIHRDDRCVVSTVPVRNGRCRLSTAPSTVLASTECSPATERRLRCHRLASCSRSPKIWRCLWSRTRCRLGNQRLMIFLGIRAVYHSHVTGNTLSIISIHPIFSLNM